MPFSRSILIWTRKEYSEVCLQEDFEVRLVQLPVTVHQITFPLCLAVARFARNASVRPHTGGIPEWPLQQVPKALTQSEIDMSDGQTIYPFADSPHITKEGFIHSPCLQP